MGWEGFVVDMWGRGVYRVRWGHERERETLQDEGTTGHCKTKVLQDIARRRFYRVLQDEGTAAHCKMKVLQDIAT
jgi:hypothetical protein